MGRIVLFSLMQKKRSLLLLLRVLKIVKIKSCDKILASKIMLGFMLLVSCKGRNLFTGAYTLEAFCQSRSNPNGIYKLSEY